MKTRGKKITGNVGLLIGSALLLISSCIGIWMQFEIIGDRFANVFYAYEIASLFAGLIWLHSTSPVSTDGTRPVSSTWIGLSLFGLVALALGWESRLIGSVALEEGTGNIAIRLSRACVLLHVVLLAAASVTLWNLERIFRGSVGLSRWGIKYVLLGVALVFAARIYTASQAILFSGVTSSMLWIESMTGLLGLALIGFGWLRSRGIGAGLHPSGRVIGGSVTIAVVGAYLIVVGLVGQAAARWGGFAGLATGSFVILAALTVLGGALMSDRLRQRFRIWISRHFNRPTYDYRVLWADFSERTATRTKAADYYREVTAFVSDTFQALSVSLFILDRERRSVVLEASTAAGSGDLSRVVPMTVDQDRLIGDLMKEPLPFDLDAGNLAWGKAFAEAHPVKFEIGGNRHCSRIVAGGTVLGFFILSDRVAGQRYTAEDLDLLQRLSDQVGAGVARLQLQERLMRAREVEAFQTMATFFVHDLKNTASTLSLTLANLPRRFDDPEFRKDALGSMGRCVDRMRDLIHRMTSLRSTLNVEREKVDINELVRRTMRDLPVGSGIVLSTRLDATGAAEIDPGQIGKVLTNLVLNAREAMGENGRIEIETARRNGWTVLTVRDDGPGMPPGFVNSRLFKPFQTTKKNGIGIGMFQSRMIVDAHGGRLEVESEPGKGATFRAYLPTAKD